MAMHCLVVDDNDYFLVAVRCMLERGGIAIAGTATSGAEALERAEETRPDIVLLDVCLGSDSGFDVAQRIAERARADLRADWQPIIILISSLAEDDLAERIAASPAVGFLDKSTLSANKVRELVSAPPG